MQAPRYASITLSLDTEKLRLARRESLGYLVDRLLTGQPVADSEFAYYGIKVSIRDAISPEIPTST